MFLPPDHPAYFDLEDPVSLARLREPMTALGGLQGLVVIDEIQRAPHLFQVLRVLADRTPLELGTHPKVGASWEGYAIEEILAAALPLAALSEAQGLSGVL